MRELDEGYRNDTREKLSTRGDRDYEAYELYRRRFRDFYQRYGQGINAPNVAMFAGLGELESEIVRRRILDRALYEYGRTTEERRE